MRNTLCFITCSVICVQVALSERAKCKKPNGVEGDVIVDGCEQLTCTAISKKKAIWVEGPAMWVSCVITFMRTLKMSVLLFSNDCCVYNGTMSPVYTEVDYISPDNGCTHVNIWKISFLAPIGA